MQAISLVRKVRSLGGEAEIKSSEHKGFDGQPYTSHEVVGTLNGYDVHMIGLTGNFFTVRRISDRGYYDPSADYNSGNWSYCHRLLELERYAREEVAA